MSFDWDWCRRCCASAGHCWLSGGGGGGGPLGGLAAAARSRSVTVSLSVCGAVRICSRRHSHIHSERSTQTRHSPLPDQHGTTAQWAGATQSARASVSNSVSQTDPKKREKQHHKAYNTHTNTTKKDPGCVTHINIVPVKDVKMSQGPGHFSWLSVPAGGRPDGTRQVSSSKASSSDSLNWALASLCGGIRNCRAKHAIYR